MTSTPLKICIDAGHGGRDPGAVGRRPFVLQEKDVNLEIALHLESELERRGWPVIMTRRQERSLGLGSRARFANRHNADLFISLHANAASVDTAEGMEVFHFPGSIHGKRLAEGILTSMLHRFPDHRRRGIKEANFTVLRRTVMPAVLVETEFLTHPRQLQFLADEVNQHALAVAIADGIPRRAAFS